MMQNYALAGLPTPEETQQEFQAVLEEIEQKEITDDEAKSWTQWLGCELDGFILDRLLRDDSFSFLIAGSEQGNRSEHAKKVFKIAKSPKFVELPERLTITHSTQCLRIAPFDTAPITVSINDLIDVQFERLSELNDNSVIKVEELSEEGDNHHYRMPFVHGRLLRDLMADKRMDLLLKREALLRTFVSVARTLQRLESGTPDFYHGNLKPENILVTETGTVLLDPGYFGAISSVEGDFENGMVSTVAYYPFLEPDDLLAFGICLFEAMTGIHPFDQRLAALSPDESFEPTRLSAEICDTINFRRSLLQPYTTPLYILQPPRAIQPDLSEALEVVLLKGLRARVDKNGTIHATTGYSDLQEFRTALQGLLEAAVDERVTAEQAEAAQQQDVEDERRP
jgi:serine/threonine protein kinase